MKESTLSTIRQHFRFKSVFLMVFTAMVLLCLGLCSVFSIFFAQNIIRNTIRDRVSANQTHLNGLVSSTDTYISQLHQSLTQLSSSRSALALAFSSSLQQSRVNDALTDLILAKDTNPLVASSILYMPRMDCIITSSYTVHTFDDYVGNSLLASYENGDMAETLLEQGGKTTSIFFTTEVFGWFGIFR